MNFEFKLHYLLVSVQIDIALVNVLSPELKENIAIKRYLLYIHTDNDIST